MPKRVDANQAEIVAALRDIGARVLDLHEVGKGCPDLLVEYRRALWLIEVKDGEKPPSKRRLTPAEEKFFLEWDTPIIVKSADEAIRYITGYASPADVPPF